MIIPPAFQDHLLSVSVTYRHTGDTGYLLQIFIVLEGLEGLKPFGHPESLSGLLPADRHTVYSVYGFSVKVDAAQKGSGRHRLNLLYKDLQLLLLKNSRHATIFSVYFSSKFLCHKTSIYLFKFSFTDFWKDIG